MGRFASTVEFYARYREPYSPDFFRKVSEQLAWTGREHLLDVGCGPGLLTLGFAPYVAHATGIDPEPGMLHAARAAAARAHNVTFTQTRLEDFTTPRRFEIISIGRALHWLDRDPALRKLDELLAPGGCILICGAPSVEGELSPWLKAFNDTRRRWVTEDETRYRANGADWFAGSRFEESGTISVTELRTVSVDDLIGRALSRSNTSPQILGDRRPAFEAELRKALDPFARSGPLQEHVMSMATIFRQQSPA